MAVDKLVDSTALDTSLTAIADAIRAKTGGSSQLVFPMGFVGGVNELLKPTGTKSITQNGTNIDVAQYSKVDVNVPAAGISVDDIVKNLAPSGNLSLSSSVTSIGAYALASKPITGLYAPEVTSIGAHAVRNTNSLQKALFPKLTSLGNNNQYQFQESKVQQIAFPKLTGALPANVLQACTSLTVVDAGKASSISTKATAGSTNFNTLILRKTSAITTLGAVDGIASGTKFKSGGAGGTIYIPTVLYNHLGDGTALDYQSATNWSTVYGYGTITWAKLEGSIYESEDWLTI